MVLIGSASKRIYGSLLNNHSETEIINENIFKKNKNGYEKNNKMAILMVLWWTQNTESGKQIYLDKNNTHIDWFGGVETESLDIEILKIN
jgi:hypothetical protein